MSQLTEQELKSIIFKRRNWLAENSIQDWTDKDTIHVVLAAATLFQERVKGLLTVCQYVLDIIQPDTPQQIREIKMKIKEAITNYKESLK